MTRLQLETWSAFCEDPTETTFERLYEESSALVYTMALRILGDEEDARDAFQSTYCRLLLLARQTRESRQVEDAAALVCRLAVREADALRQRRRRRSRKEVAVDIEPVAKDPRHSPADDAHRRDVRRRVAALVAALPRKYRVPISLHYFDGLTHQEIAAALGISRSTVSGRISRGTRRLRPALLRAGLGESAAVFAAIAVLRQLVAPPSCFAAAGVFRAATGAAAATGVASAGTAGYSSSLATSLTWLASAKGKMLAAGIIAAVAIGTWTFLHRPDERGIDPPPDTSVAVVPSSGEAETADAASKTPARASAVPSTSGASADGTSKPPRDALPASASQPKGTGAGAVATDDDASPPSIFGRVFLRDTGQPAAGAMVVLLPDGPAVTADDEGTFEFRGAEPGRVAVGARLGAYLSHLSPQDVEFVPLGDGQRLGPIDLALVRGLELSGRAADEETGRPIPGAKVSISLPVLGTLEAVTDAAGRYRFEGLPAMETRLDVRAEGYAFRRVLYRLAIDASGDCPLDLEPEGIVEILAVDPEGTPLEGVRVSYFLEESFAGWEDSRSTDADGRLVLRGVSVRHPPRLAASLEGYALREHAVPRFESGDRQAQITLVLRPEEPAAEPNEVAAVALEGGHRAEIIVIDEDGHPLRDVMLCPFVAGREAHEYLEIPGQPRRVSPARTDAQGRVTLADLPSETVYVDLWAYRRTDIRHREIALDAQTEIVMKPSGAIRGRVVDGDTGEPVPDFIVKVSGGGVSVTRSGPGQKVSDDEGRFVLDDLNQDRTFAVTVEASGYMPLRRESVASQAPDDERVETFTISRGKGLSGVVLDATSRRPIGGASVVGAIPENGLVGWERLEDGERPAYPQISSSVADERGSFTLEEGDEKLTLFVRAAGYGRRVIPPRDRITSRRGPPGTLEILLEPAATIRGVVTANREPLSGARLQLVRPGARNESFEPVRTDASGAFRIDDLSAGDYRLGVWRSRGRVSFGWISRGLSLQTGEEKEIELGADLGQFALEGRVLDAEGRPVEEARVALAPAFSWHYGTLVDYSLRDGTYRVEGLRAGAYTVRVSKHEHSHDGRFRELKTSDRVEIAADARRDFAFAILRKVIIRVADPRSTGSAPRMGLQRAFLEQVSTEIGIVNDADHPLSSASGEIVDGRAELEGWFRGEYRLSFLGEAADGSLARCTIAQPLALDTTTADQDLGEVSLPSGGSATVEAEILAADGSAVEGATLALEPAFDWEYTWFLGRAANDGRCRISGLRPGRYSARVQPPRTSGMVSPVAITESIEVGPASRFTFRLPEEHRITVRFVVDGDGPSAIDSPFPSVVLERSGWDRHHPAQPDGTQNSQFREIIDGQVSFLGRFEGEYSLRLNYRRAGQTASIPVGATVRLDPEDGDRDLGDVPVPLSRLGTLPVRVETESAEQPIYATVYLFPILPAGGRGRPTITGVALRSTDETLATALEGSYEVAVSAPGFRCEPSSIRVDVRAGREVPRKTWRLVPVGIIEGAAHVEFASRQNVCLSRVLVEGDGVRRDLLPSAASTESTPHDLALGQRDMLRGHQLVITDLPSGVYSVRMEAEGYAPRVERVEVATGRRQYLRVGLTARAE